MPDMTGSFSGEPSWQTSASVHDVADHEVSFGQISGKQKTDDPNWKDATVTYWATTDVIAGNGTQRGYFCNDHGGGARDWGVFEGKVTTAGNETTVEGTWRYTGGSGKFKGLTGNGSFKSRFVTPTQIDTQWKGTYQLAAAAAGAS